MKNKLVSTYGYLKYDPPRDGMKSYKGNWLVLELPISLAKYYQYFIKKELFIPVSDTTWRTHISIIRGEKPLYDKNWKKYEGKKVNIKFDPYIKKIKDPKKPGYYFIIELKCYFFDKIRIELGLPVKYNTYHITVGRTNYD